MVIIGSGIKITSVPGWVQASGSVDEYFQSCMLARSLKREGVVHNALGDVSSNRFTVS